MIPSRVLAATCVIVVFGAPAPAAPKSSLAPQLEKARDTYQAAMRKADESLIDHFDKELELLRKRRLDADERQKLVDALQLEKAEFEANRAFPWSPAMRPELLVYVRDTEAATGALKKVYDRAVAERYKAKDDRGAEELLSELATIAPVRVVATWVSLKSTGETGALTRKFYSDGRYQAFSGGQEVDTGSTRTWSLSKNEITITSKSSADRGGQTIVFRCTTDLDGQTFTVATKGGETRWRLVRESNE